MGGVAVLAHTGKTMGGGLDELRRRLAEAGVPAPLWYEVRKSRKASRRAAEAVAAGAELLFVWGGDGTVQRCLDAVAGRPVALAILPAGAANLLASWLSIPSDLARAVDIGLHGQRRRLDLGVLNGERFAVMAGAGFDARMLAATGARRKRRWGPLAYVWSGVHELRGPVVRARVDLDGVGWYTGPLSCVLVGNIGRISGGLAVFPAARADDGWLEVGVVTARGVVGWLGVLVRVALGRAAGSRRVRMARARSVTVSLDHELLYELDGGARSPVRRLDVSIEPGALTVCVPGGAGGTAGNRPGGAGGTAGNRPGGGAVVPRGGSTTGPP